jgi:hypothetical protein
MLRRTLLPTASLIASIALICAAATLGPRVAQGLGPDGVVDIRVLEVGDGPLPRPTAAQRLAWEVRQRTSVDTRLTPTHVRLEDPRLFESPFVYWIGDRAFPRLPDASVRALKRFVELGGALVIDDAAPEGDAFDGSVRRELGRAFGAGALVALQSTHTVFRSFYLLGRPLGRVEGPETIEAIMHGDRAAVLYTRHDLAGALERDAVGNYQHAVVPGGERQRETAMRLAVNMVLYALCLDYKDDQVHAPFIMRRRAGQR